MPQPVPNHNHCEGKGMPSTTETVEVWQSSTIPGSGRWCRCQVADRAIPVRDTNIKSHFTVEGSPEVFTRADYGKTWRWPPSDRGNEQMERRGQPKTCSGCQQPMPIRFTHSTISIGINHDTFSSRLVS
jgi:hypothetical protein